MPAEYIRLSQQAKEQLVKLKRYTGIENWNVLCRWGFCLSLAEPTIPTDIKIPADSNVEMSWKVFGGKYHELYSALLKERCLNDHLSIDEETLSHQFRLHLHRGIAYLSGNPNIRSIQNFLSIAIPIDSEK
ncbi:MAG: DNA sulfur modification protein DndE [Magnetococcales bacterium]|nr:DNA sulfur modification protein DndE [Magnetococcales bacterium]